MNFNQKINLKEDRLVINVLGEVCWGFHIDNFEQKIGVKKEFAETLLQRLLKQEQAEAIETYLNSMEIECIKRAFKEVLKEIEEWEFSTRIGISIEEAQKIMEKLPDF